MTDETITTTVENVTVAATNQSSPAAVTRILFSEIVPELDGITPYGAMTAVEFTDASGDAWVTLTAPTFHVTMALEEWEFLCSIILADAPRAELPAAGWSDEAALVP